MSYPSTPQPNDPGISRRRAEAIKPFVDRALELQQRGWLDPDRPIFQLAARGGYGGFSGPEWLELVEAFKPGN